MKRKRETDYHRAKQRETECDGEEKRDRTKLRDTVTDWNGEEGKKDCNGEWGALCNGERDGTERKRETDCNGEKQRETECDGEEKRDRM